MPPPMAADAVAEAVLVPTPLAVLPMAADEAEDGLAPTPLAVLAADAIETVLAPMALAPSPPAVVDDGAELVAAPTLPIADDAEAVLVPIPVADPPPVTADDADADSAAAPVTPASPPKQAVETNPSVTPAEDEEVPSQGDIEKVSEYMNAMLLPTLQKSCGMVTDMKENETGHCSLVTDMKENETGHCSMVTDMKENDDGESNHATVETVHPLNHSVSGNQHPMAIFEDEDVQKSGTQPPLSCPSDQQQNLMLGCERNDKSQDVSRAKSVEKLNSLEMRNMRLCRRGFVDPRLVMGDRYMEDVYNMGLGFDNIRDIGHCNQSDHIHDGDACHLDYQYDHNDAQFPSFRRRGRRIGCPCRRCGDQRYHRNSGHQCQTDLSPRRPMDMDDVSDPSLSDGSDHIDDDDAASHYGTFDYHYPYQFFHERAKRSECPCHFNDRRRNHRQCGYPYQHGFNPYSPMDIARERWSPPEHLVKEKFNVGAALFNPNRWTCFLNCILQCMVHTVPLVLKLREADHPDPCPRDSVGFCCYCSLKQHANESIKRSGSAIYPMSFVDNLSSISSDFEKGVQQDAQEFLRCLLDKLDEASIAPSSSEEPPTIEGGIAKEIFGGRLKSQLHCPQCDHWSDRSEPFLDLSLEINMVETLVDALESFTKVELIEGVMCDGCKSRVNMEKHLKIEQAPEVLVVHLKRFLNSGHDITKISDKVKYTLELDIDPFMCSVDNAPQKYDLYGVVDHWGAYGRGHYVCYIRSSQADWFQFDDAKVSVCSEETVLDITSYLLFYVKQGSSPWFSSLLEKESKVRADGLAELGLGEIVKDKDETTSSGGQEGSDRFGEPAEDGNGPSLDGNTLSDALKQLEGCNLGGISGGSQELSCITVSGGENGHIDRLSEPLETKEDCSPPGSLLDNKEMKESTQGDSAGNQGSSPEDQKVSFSEAPSDFWTFSSDEEDEPRIINNGIKGVGEEGRVAGKKRKQSKSRSADDEFCKESRRQTRRK